MFEHAKEDIRYDVALLDYSFEDVFGVLEPVGECIVGRFVCEELVTRYLC